MTKEVINSKNLKLKSYLSHAIVTSELIFCSGQVPKNPETGEIVNGDVKAQTKQVLVNVKLVLEAAGSSLDKAVKVTIFLTDLSGYSQMNEVYATYFPDNPPARACIEVSGLANDEYKVEIELIATK